MAYKDNQTNVNIGGYVPQRIPVRSNLDALSQAFNTSLSGLSQAWNNFYTSGRTAYEDDQARIAMIASSKDATPTRLIEMGYHISPQVIAALYNTSTDQHTKDFYLSMLNDKQRRKYGIS